MTVFKTAIATYPHTKGLKDGTVSVPVWQFEHVEISPIIGAFRRMCRTLDFDVCRDGDYDVPDCQGSRQAVHGAARLRHAAVPPFPDLLQHEVRGEIAERSRRQEGGRARVHRHHRCVGEGDSRDGVRRRPRQNHLGGGRRRTRARIPQIRQRVGTTRRKISQRCSSRVKPPAPSA